MLGYELTDHNHDSNYFCLPILPSLLSVVRMLIVGDGYHCKSLHAKLTSVQMVDSTIAEHKHPKDTVYRTIHVPSSGNFRS